MVLYLNDAAVHNEAALERQLLALACQLRRPLRVLGTVDKRVLHERWIGVVRADLSNHARIDGVWIKQTKRTLIGDEHDLLHSRSNGYSTSVVVDENVPAAWAAE